MKDSAMAESAGQSRNLVSFGPFILVATERRLTRDGVTVPLGGRTLDTLIALLARHGQPIDKRDLIAQVWPDVTVDEGSLRFHIARLRQALGDGKDGARYIATLAGRGYCFVAPVTRSGDRDKARAPVAVGFTRANLPSRLARMVGRTDGVRLLSTQLVAVRFVTIVGSGGVGKTTVAVAVAHSLNESFAGVVLFVDLASLSDPTLVVVSVAAMFGLPVHASDPIRGLIAYLRDKRILLIFDNCEHIIGAVASLAASIFAAAPYVHILATSREALRVEGEHVHRLESLACPPDEPGLTAATVLAFPAVQLFVDRAVASGAHLDLTDADAAIVACICRRLDGVALAIVLAAGRVEAYGLQRTAALLDERLSLLWHGQRTAPPRQQTLKATLDWSYELLTRPEQQVLRQLAVFVGDFTLDAALAVLTNPAVDQMLVLGAIESLVTKSMVASDHTSATIRYRLLETTRAYALEIDLDDTEFANLAARHATHYRHWLEQAGSELPTLSDAERTLQLADLGNVRAALEWCFGPTGNVEIGAGLAAAAAPFFMAMSLSTECFRWSEQAISALDDATSGGREEMHLQAALGMSTMLTRGTTEAALAALERGLTLAERRGDAIDQLMVLLPLQTFHCRVGDYHTSLPCSERAAEVAATIGDPAALELANATLGIVLHVMGDHRGARVKLERALLHGPGSRRTTATYLGFDGYNIAGIGLAGTLWLLGYPAQAIERARQAVNDAAGLDHPVTLSIVLIRAFSIFLGTGALQIAEEHADWLMSYAQSHSLGPYLTAGQGFKSQLAILRGDVQDGVENLQHCLKELHAMRYEVVTTAFNVSLAQGLGMLGRVAEGIKLIDETIQLAEVSGDLCYMPEILRVKGFIFLSMPQPHRKDAEMCFRRSLDWSRRQGALAWELRTAIDLATLLAEQGQPDSARTLLTPVFEQFVEGLDTTDLKAAKRLLASFG